MTIENLASKAAVGAVVAGIGWGISGIAAIAFPGWDPGPIGSASYYVIETTHAIAETGMVAALAGLWWPQRDRVGRFGRAGFWIAIAATALLAVITYLSAILPGIGVDPGGNEALASILFVISLLGTLIGFIFFGVATMRTRVWPSLTGVLLIAHPTLLMALLGVYPIGIAIGLLWFGIARALLAGSTEARVASVEGEP